LSQPATVASPGLAHVATSDEAVAVSELDLNDVAVLVRVLERAGFARAARELGVPTSTVSRAVARLESSLGTLLVHRNTRSVTATNEGRAFYAEVAPAMLALQRAARTVDGSDLAPRGRLRLSAPNDLGSSFVAGVVTAFAERYPKVDVDVELSMRKVNLVEEGFDLALRASDKLNDSALVARRVGDLEAELYASLGYVQAHGLPATIEAVAEHACVLFRAKSGEAEWVLHGPSGLTRQRVRGRISGDDFTFVRAAALSGAGVALLPRLVAAEDLAAGRLVRVLPAYTQRGASLHVVYARTRKVPAKILVFRDFVLEAFVERARIALPGASPPRPLPEPKPPERSPPELDLSRTKRPRTKRSV
jgi:DNA-binding transcriptional LysR family regulator